MTMNRAIRIRQKWSAAIRRLKKWTRKKDIFSAIGYAILSVGGYANIAYYKVEAVAKDDLIKYQEAKLVAADSEADSLVSVVAGKNKAINILIANQIAGSGGFELLDQPAWLKVLNIENDTYVITYLNKAYGRLLPSTLSRFDLFGKTGHALDIEFGNYYQLDDKKVARTGASEIFPEPYRVFGTGAVLCGRFLKGRISKNGDEITLYGLYVEDCDQKEREVMLMKMEKLRIKR